MAKSKNRRKKNKKGISMPSLSIGSYIRKVARKLPLHECKIYDNWKEQGKTQILVSRLKPNGSLIVGFYLVDTFCLGLKDSFYREMSRLEYDEIVRKTDNTVNQKMGDNFVDADPTLVFNIIYGAIEYAEGLGFSPSKNFSVSEYILEDVETLPFMEIEFGEGGMPLYINGPYDNIQRVLKTLEKNVGTGNYHFINNIGEFENLM